MTDLRYAFADIVAAFGKLRLWAFFALKQLQLQYRRNVLGMVWVVVSFGVPALGIGWLLAELQNIPLSQHVPHVVFGFVGWNFASSCITEGCYALTRNRGLILQAPMERSVFALSLTLNKFILMLFQLVAAMGIVAVFGWRPSMSLLFLPVAFAILFVTGFASVLLFSLLAARIRDIGELAASLVRLLFFFTPIIWATGRRGLEGGVLELVATLNPFTYFVDILRMPLVGTVPDALTLTVTLSLMALTLLMSVIALAKLGRTVTFFV